MQRRPRIRLERFIEAAAERKDHHERQRVGGRGNDPEPEQQAAATTFTLQCRQPAAPLRRTSRAACLTRAATIRCPTALLTPA